MKRRNLSLILSAVMLTSCFSGVTVLAESEGISTSVTSDYTGNIFYDKTPVELKINFKNNDSGEKMLDAFYTITDTDGRQVSNGEFEDVSLKSGEENEQTVSLGAMDYGSYVINITNDGNTESFNFSSSVKSKSIDKNGHLGVGTHMLRYNDEEIGKVSELLDNAGITWIRDEYYWDNIEKEKGKYDFKYDGYIDSITGKGNNVLVILDYGNPLYGGTPHDEEGYKAYADYCYALATHLKGKVDTFEIWNEWSGGFGGGYGPEIYAEMLKHAYPAIKKANPDATVITCATADVDLGWIRKVLEIAGPEYMDGISVHPYAYPASPESGGLKSNIRKVHQLAKEYGKDVMVWCTEMGYPSTPDMIDEFTSGAYKARIYIYAQTLPENDKLCLDDFQNDGIEANNNEHNFGMIRTWKDINSPFSAKPGYLAIANASNILGDAKFCEVTAEDDNYQIYRFDKDGKGILALWMLDGSENVSLDVGCDEVTLIDWMGNEQAVTTTEGVVTVSATERPEYIVGDFNSYKRVDNSFGFIEGKIASAKGESITLELDRGKALVGGGTIEAELPEHFIMEGDTEIGDGTENVKIILNTDSEVQNGNYRALFTIKSDGKVIGKLNAVIDIVEDTEVKVLPVLTDTKNWSRWKIRISVKNNSREKDTVGKITITEPEEYAGMVIDVPSISFDETYTKDINVTTPPENKLIPLKIKYETNSGEVKELSRPISCLAAVKRENEITIDGKMSVGEWDDSMIFYLDDTSKIHGYRGQGEMEKYGGEEDLSGFGYLKWDDEYFYMLVQTKDDIHIQSSSGSGIWQGDGLQYCIDPSRGEGIGKNNWHEIGIGVDENGVTHMWKWLSIPGIAGGEVKDYVGCANRDEETKTDTYEVKIPWKQLLPLGTNISAGDVIGFSVIANEDDGKGRDGWVQYMSGIGASKNAYEFGDVILLDKSKDISDSRYPWANPAANELYKKGILSYDYSGDKQVTKGEFINMISEALEIDGKELGEYDNPNEAITREDMVVILDKACQNGTDGGIEILKKFADNELISDYAVQSFANLVSKGIISGDGAMLNPKNIAVLSEAAVAVYNTMK